jgi:hypothetical protein
MATPKQVRARGRLSLVLAAIVATVLFAAVAYASDADMSVADVTAPTGSVSLAPGGNGNINISVEVTGNQTGTATFEVNRNWTLSGGTFTGSNPEEFTVGPRAGGDPPNVFTTTGTVNVAAGQASGTFTLATQVFDITNTNTTGAKLGVGDASSYSVTVLAPVPDVTPPLIAITSPVNGASTANSSIDVGGTASDASGIESVKVNGNTATLGAGSSWSYNDLALACGANPISATARDNAGNQTTTAAISVTRLCDTTAPAISYTLNPASPDGDNGWYTSNVSLTWHVSEPESPGSLVKTGCVDQSITSDQSATTYSCSATSDGGSAGPVSLSIKRDATYPVINGSRSPLANANGWNNESVSVNFTCSDALSGVASCGPNATLSSEGANQDAFGITTDNAGNQAFDLVTGINIDLTDPSVSLVGGPADGESYYFGSVPAAPTCNASDALSGLDGSCSVSGGGSTVGPHSYTATATDKAGNESSVTHNYTVLAWTLKGFYQPVDMGANVVNTVKGGSTVPLKFEVFAGPNELTDPAIVQSFTQKLVACGNFSGDSLDEIEVTSTGGTSLRYDTTGGQFIQNWKTPTGAAKCYVVTMTTDDGSSISAQFKTK